MNEIAFRLRNLGKKFRGVQKGNLEKRNGRKKLV